MFVPPAQVLPEAKEIRLPELLLVKLDTEMFVKEDPALVRLIEELPFISNELTDKVPSRVSLSMALVSVSAPLARALELATTITPPVATVPPE